MKPANPKASLRCAVYTRVSTEHGLEQEFNSLDNQREASEAYIKSHTATSPEAGLQGTPGRPGCPPIRDIPQIWSLSSQPNVGAAAGSQDLPRSREELTPIIYDPLAAIPIAAAITMTILSPQSWQFFTAALLGRTH